MLTVLALTLLEAISPLDVEGTWQTEDGRSKVEIRLEEGEKPVGRVVWVDPQSLDPARAAGPIYDRHNPDSQMALRPIIGLPIIYGFERSETAWRRGEIYDPSQGATYRARLQRVDQDTLMVKGCVAVLCREQIWTKSPLLAQHEAEALALSPDPQ